MSQTKGEKNPLANVKYGIQEDTPPAAKVETDPPTEDRNAKFEALIKGEYKDLYDARMQDTIQKRLKSTKETVDKYEALTPTLEMLAKKYGVDASDIKALNKAIEEDDAYYEEEALEKGISVEQLKEIRKMEKENADLKRQMEEQNRKENANKVYAQWMEQAESTKQIYPSFDLRAEMQNQRFVDLLRSNIDVRTAYEVIHKDDIIAGAMQFTAKKMEQNITNKIIANGARPSENGNSSQSASVVKSDVSQLSKADRQEIIRRVQRGEKIRF
jgi:vacuolar-type H+-ATPase subunit I/STV1